MHPVLYVIDLYSFSSSSNTIPFEEKNLGSIHIPLPLKNCILWSMHVLPLCLQQIHIPLTSQTQILNNSDNPLVEEEENQKTLLNIYYSSTSSRQQKP